MTIRPRPLWLPAFLVLALAAPAAATADVIVNINAAHYGYQESSATPVVGDSVTLINEAPGGYPNQVLLTAGTYRVTNADGELGSLFNGFRFNEATTGENWAWNFLISDSAGKIVLYGEGAALAATAQQLAAQESVQNFVAYFTLTANTLLNFSVRDNAVGDNTGGISLRIAQVDPLNPAATPEPASLAMMGVGVLATVAVARRRRVARAA